jgi:hypothetical protein
MTVAIIPGCIIGWDEYELANGELDSKIFVIVGARPDCNYQGIRTTSKKRWRTYQPEDGADYYFIPGGKVEWFDLDSWILFSDPQEFTVMVSKEDGRRKTPYP